MIPPAVASQVHRAMVAWSHLQRRHGQQLPEGWDAYHQLVALAARADQLDPVPDWLTLAEAADRARVSPSTLYRWRTDGLPSRTVRGRVLIARTDLDRWVRSPADRLPVRTVHEVA